MNGIGKFACIALLSSLAVLAQAQAERFTGIWQSESNPEAYYSLHVVGNEVVLIDMATLEFTGETLAASFHGTIGLSQNGTPMATVRALDAHPNGQRSAEIVPRTDGTLTIYWCNQPDGECVLGILTHIRKVF